jgi:glycosyltransferase involved in cell wall biosynthesis
MHILHVTDSFLPEINGTAVFVDKLSRMLKTKGDRTSIWTTGASFTRKKSFSDGRLIVREASVPLFFNQNSQVSIFPYFFCKRILRDVRPDIVHIHTPGIMGITALFWAKVYDVPVVFTNHIMAESVTYNLKVMKLMRPIFNHAIWGGLAKLYSFADLTISPSASAQSFITSKGYKNKHEIISNGIVANMSNNRRKNSSANVFTLLYLGRLDFEKRVDAILGALPKVLKTHDVRLVVVGDGTAKGALIAQAKRLGITNEVRFEGFVTEGKDAYYEHADAYITLCPTEMQGIATLEAMSYALPIITAPTGGSAELCEDGKNGYRAESLAESDVAYAISRLLSDRVSSRKLGENSREIVAREHKFEATVDKYMKVYRKIFTKVSYKNTVKSLTIEQGKH